MTLEKEFRDFSIIGNRLAQQGVFIEGINISFDLINPGVNIISYTALAKYNEDDYYVTIAESDVYDKFIIELFDILTNLEEHKITVDEVYNKYKS